MKSYFLRKLAASIQPYLTPSRPVLLELIELEVQALRRSNESLTASNLNLLEEIFTCQNEIRAFGSYLGLDLIGDEDNPHAVPSVEARAELDQVKQTVRDRALESEEQKTLCYLLDVMRRRDKELQQRQPRTGVTKETGR